MRCRTSAIRGVGRPSTVTIRSPGRRAAAADDRRAGERVARAVADSEDARGERVAALESVADGEHVDQGHGEPDARVVEIEPADRVGRLCRQRHEDADHAAVDVDERAAVVGRRDGGVGLHSPAPAPLHGRQHADRHGGRGRAPAATDGDRPLSGGEGRSRDGLEQRRVGQRVGGEQHDAPRFVAAAHSAAEPAAVGQDDDRG
jgi:hypothetical protein